MDSDEDARRPAARHYERRVLGLAFLTGLPGSGIALLLLWTGDYSTRLQWTLTVLIAAFWLGLTLTLLERVVRPLQTISNMLAALREGDFSIRARGARSDDALGLALLEVNMLGQTLRDQRLGALEATALLRAVMSEVDVAIFAFDEQYRLRLVNRGGERLLGETAERLLGRTSAGLGLAEYLHGSEDARTFDATFPSRAGRWEVRRGMFRQGGRRHQFLVITDLSRALREEERQAWQRLVRVLGHEINNSLTPIKSIAGSLQGLMSRERRAADWEEDVRQGLSVIAGRSEALSRFMSSYALLARLPRPKRAPLGVCAWVERVVRLETRLPVTIVPGPDISIHADGDQLDQLLINLVRNGADAAMETGGGVHVGWTTADSTLELWVEDEGLGLSDTANLFVPFFTTKPNGSGIGLALSRQIAEAHGGTLTLANRRDARGCEARLRIPI
ncbi:MAG TPA: ATP-binding protein [Gemmatimonadaceae bacterium]|jgi:PAS domain S-box-containing protein|nr:ATP-binding protein [Gemmatimonadaceae bacterium]